MAFSPKFIAAFYGKISRDPETKEINGKNILKLPMSVYCRKDTYAWCEGTCWERLAEEVREHNLVKGDTVFVSGSMSGVYAYTKQDGQASATVQFNLTSVMPVKRVGDQAEGPSGGGGGWGNGGNGGQGGGGWGN